MKNRSWPPVGSVVQPLRDASLVLFKCMLHGTQQRCRIVRLFDNRRVWKFFRVYVVGAHTCQKYKWYALCMEQSSNIEAVPLHTT